MKPRMSQIRGFSLMAVVQEPGGKDFTMEEFFTLLAKHNPNK